MRKAYPNELYHHGIKGQKWGVRRFQNPDGSLTTAGKRRYLIRPKDVNNQNFVDQQAQQAHQQAIQAHQQAINDANFAAQQAHEQAVQQAVNDANFATQQASMTTFMMPMMFGKKGKKADNKPIKLTDAEKERIINSGDPAELSKIVDSLSMDEYRSALQRVEMNQRLKNYEELQADENWRKVEKHANRARKASNAAIYSYNTIAAINNIVNPGSPLPPINPGGGNKKKKG